MKNSDLFTRQNRNLVKKQIRLLNNKKRLEKEERRMRVLQEKYLEKLGV